MYALLSAESEDMINKLFNNIQMADKSTSGLYLYLIIKLFYHFIYIHLNYKFY